MSDALRDLEGVLRARARDRPEGSYTVSLLDDGELLQRKVMEEAFELCLELGRQPPAAELALAVSESDVSLGSELIDVRELAARLREFDVKPRPLRRGNEVFRGYCRADFQDAFARYLPATGVTVSRL